MRDLIKMLAGITRGQVQRLQPAERAALVRECQRVLALTQGEVEDECNTLSGSNQRIGPMPDRLVTISASIEDRLILKSAVAGAQVASILAEMDAVIATQGISRAEARDWVRNALETGRYVKDIVMTERLLSTLLWLACRGDASGSMEETLRHGGVTLACNYLGRAQDDEPGVLGKLRFTVSTPMVH